MSRAGETVWEVFARKAYEEPLHHVGTVTESDEDSGARVGARDLRRAAVDPHDPGPAAGDPGGDPRVTGTPHAVDAATATMISLIGSLADNKSALGRRYGEWAVSAPTIESAVAAAAMAQDELGHGRSTYPVLAKLGVQREDEGLDAGHPMRSDRPGAARLGVVHRRQPGRGRDPDHVRRVGAKQHDRAAGPAGAQDPPGGGGPPGPRRGVAEADLPRRRPRPRAAAGADRGDVGRRGALAGPDDDPATARRWRRGW